MFKFEKIQLRLLMLKAHEMTRDLIKVFGGNYKAQLSLCIKEVFKMFKEAKIEVLRKQEIYFKNPREDYNYTEVEIEGMNIYNEDKKMGALKEYAWKMYNVLVIPVYTTGGNYKARFYDCSKNKVIEMLAGKWVRG